MNKGQAKNIVIILLLTISLFSVYKFISSLREKYELMNSLNLAKQQVTVLEDEKQNLLREIEKDKKLRQKLTQQNLELKDYLKAGKARMGKLFKVYEGTQETIEQLNSKFSLLKAENTAIITDKELLSKENEALKIKLNSVIELKKAMRELRKQAQKVGIQIIKKTDVRKTLEGNQGYVIKDGKLNNPAKVKIEVVPAPVK